MKRCVAAAVMGISFVTVLSGAATGDRDRAKVITLHAQVITPASDALFKAESQPPATPEEWEKIAARASDLSRAANGLKSLKSAQDKQAWLGFAHALSAAAERAVRAAQARNQEGLLSANNEVVSVCEDCHAKYRDAGRSMNE
jgi:cytochrome c556